MTQEALKLALEALENSVDLVREDAYQAEKLYGNYPTRQGKVNGLKVLADDHEKAITVLKEVLAQPEQEPVAFDVWLQECESMTMAVRHGVKFLLMPEESAVRIGTAIQNTTPPQRAWVGLTDEDCKSMSAGDKVIAMWADRTLKEKNT